MKAVGRRKRVHGLQNRWVLSPEWKSEGVMDDENGARTEESEK